MSTRLSSRDALERPLKYGLAISFALHLLFLLLINRPLPKPSEPMTFSVTLEKPLQPRRQNASQQIVTPSKRVDQNEPRDPHFLSDNSNSVPQEQIHHGDAPDAASVVGRLAPPSAPSKPQQAQQPRKQSNQKEAKQQQPAPKKEAKQKGAPAKTELRSLKLDNGTLFEKFSGTKTEKQNTESALAAALSGAGPQQPRQNLRSYQPFSRPAGSGALILGSRGSNDYLPNLPDGDITLLNTKANLFAVFVRRVATNVFAELRNSGWELLRKEDIQRLADFSTVRATLSLKGELLGVTLESSSGSDRFDQVLYKAVKQGSRDPNPPAGAVAPDGLIHLIFEARSWSQDASSARTGALFERRWLVLGTGLE